MGCGENVHLATWSSSEALQNSSFVKAAFFFNVVSAFQAHIINNCTYENKSHCHNIHSFQGIIYRLTNLESRKLVTRDGSLEYICCGQNGKKEIKKHHKEIIGKMVNAKDKRWDQSWGKRVPLVPLLKTGQQKLFIAFFLCLLLEYFLSILFYY